MKLKELTRKMDAIGQTLIDDVPVLIDGREFELECVELVRRDGRYVANLLRKSRRAKR